MLGADELGAGLVEVVVDGSLGDGENDWVWVPLLPPHAASAATEQTTRIAVISRRDNLPLLPLDLLADTRA